MRKIPVSNNQQPPNLVPQLDVESHPGGELQEEMASRWCQPAPRLCLPDFHGHVGGG